MLKADQTLFLQKTQKALERAEEAAEALRAKVTVIGNAEIQVEALQKAADLELRIARSWESLYDVFRMGADYYNDNEEEASAGESNTYDE